MRRIVDLWQAKEDAARIYQIYLAHVQMKGLHLLVASACRQIQPYVRATVGRAENYQASGEPRSIRAWCSDVEGKGH